MSVRQFVHVPEGVVEVPAAFRGNCVCGKWLIVPNVVRASNPARCECGREYYFEEDGNELVFTRRPYEVRPILALDLDGTVRYSKSGDFISGSQDVALYEDVEKILWEYKDKGYLIYGITNQGGVAFEYKTELGALSEHTAMYDRFIKDPFSGTVTCYNHPDGSLEPYNCKSLRRKPYYGMLVEIELLLLNKDIIVDWNNSIMVGDREEDQQCAKAAGIKFVWTWKFFGRLEPES